MASTSNEDFDENFRRLWTVKSFKKLSKLSSQLNCQNRWTSGHKFWPPTYSIVLVIGLIFRRRRPRQMSWTLAELRGTYHKTLTWHGGVVKDGQQPLRNVYRFSIFWDPPPRQRAAEVLHETAKSVVKRAVCFLLNYNIISETALARYV